MSESDTDLDAVHRSLREVRAEIAKRIVGQEAVIDQLLACVLSDGNALLEGNPGLAKTLLVRTMADVTDLSFSRIQNTPDLMPSDITGTEIIREVGGEREFEFDKGPIFANVVLADEINRATPKTQSALLEAMEEQQVTASGDTYDLPDPFFLLATQNPIDQEGSLHPSETLYMNGRLWTAEDALVYAQSTGELIHEGQNTRLYDVDASTQTLAADGSMQETDCMVYETEYEGSMYTVETKTGRTIRVTGNHPFLVNRDGAIQWVEARDIDDADFLVTPRQLDLPEQPFEPHESVLAELAEHGYTVLRSGRVNELLDKLDSTASLSTREIDELRIAAGLSKKDLASRVDASYDRVLDFFDGAVNNLDGQLQAALQGLDIQVGDYVESHRIHRIDDVLTPAEAGFFIGFVFAEGHVTETAVSISQENLAEEFDRWVRLAERIGLAVAIRERDTGREADITSKPFVDYLKSRFQVTSPSRLLSAPAAFKEAFLETVLLTESDYDADRRRVTFVQQDREVTNLVAHLLIDIGIIPWLSDRNGRFELRIQGQDIARYLDRFEWRGKEPEAADFESVYPKTPLPRDEETRLIDRLGMQHNGLLSSRDWSNSYAWMRSGRNHMGTKDAEHLLEEADDPLAARQALDIETAIENDNGAAAKECGRSMTDIVANTDFSKHQARQSYSTAARPDGLVDSVAAEDETRMEEAAKLTEHRRNLIDGDVYYDQVVDIQREPYEGPVIGLSVPEHHNYVAGFGACGINHNTYPLPEAQADRFMLKIVVDFPSFAEEREVVDRYTSGVDADVSVERVLARERLMEIQGLARQVPIAEDLKDMAVSLVQETREVEHIEFGASPRASMALVLAAKARALLNERTHVSEADIEAMAKPVLRHRIVVDFRAEREGMTPDDAIDELV